MRSEHAAPRSTPRPQRTVCTAGHRGASSVRNHGRAKGVPFHRTGRCTRCIVMRPTGLVRARSTSACDPTGRARRQMCLRTWNHERRVRRRSGERGRWRRGCDLTREPLVCCEKRRPVPEEGTGRITDGASRWRGVDGVGAAMEQSATTLATGPPTCAAESKWRASAVLCRCDHS